MNANHNTHVYIQTGDTMMSKGPVVLEIFVGNCINPDHLSACTRAPNTQGCNEKVLSNTWFSGNTFVLLLMGWLGV
jgi:hypothetical protein